MRELFVIAARNVDELSRVGLTCFVGVTLLTWLKWRGFGSMAMSTEEHCYADADRARRVADVADVADVAMAILMLACTAVLIFRIFGALYAGDDLRFALSQLTVFGGLWVMGSLLFACIAEAKYRGLLVSNRRWPQADVRPSTITCMKEGGWVASSAIPANEEST